MATSMTRQHFRALAEAVASLDIDESNRIQVAGAIASAVARFNSAFQRGKFLAACDPAPAETPAIGHHRRAAVAARQRQVPATPAWDQEADRCPMCRYRSPEMPMRTSCMACGHVLPR